MYLHPEWKGKIHQVRIAPFTHWGRAYGRFRYNYVRLGPDTRHAANNPTYILAVWRYYLWTGDTNFLRRNLTNMRRALLFLNHHLRGRSRKMIDQRPFLPGHDAFGATPDGEPNPGHGIGTNYFDQLGLGSRDLVTNLLYIRALEAMAEAEKLFPIPAVEGVRRPAVSAPRGTDEIVYEETPESLRSLAAGVRETVRREFWNPETKRFAGGIDREGNLIDYGFTFPNLQAVAIGLATPDQAVSILRWLDGERVVEGDTSQGDDIYFWRFAPRTTTRQNRNHYVWTRIPASREGNLAFGESVQDGGAVLWESYYDILARVRAGDTEGAWRRLREILDWHAEVVERGGKGPEFYRAAYPTGDPLAETPLPSTPFEGLLEGGGAHGGLGLDADFIENSLLPVAVLTGFLGVDLSEPAVFEVRPRIPEDVDFLGVTNITRAGDVINLRAGRSWVDLEGSSIRSTDWILRIRFDGEGQGKPAVFRDGEPYDSFELTKESGGSGPAVIVTDTHAAPHRYEIRWDDAPSPADPGE
jgi:hypothetical protein